MFWPSAGLHSLKRMNLPQLHESVSLDEDKKARKRYGLHRRIELHAHQAVLALNKELRMWC